MVQSSQGKVEDKHGCVTRLGCLTNYGVCFQGMLWGYASCSVKTEVVAFSEVKYASGYSSEVCFL